MGSIFSLFYFKPKGNELWQSKVFQNPNSDKDKCILTRIDDNTFTFLLICEGEMSCKGEVVNDEVQSILGCKSDESDSDDENNIIINDEGYLRTCEETKDLVRIINALEKVVGRRLFTIIRDPRGARVFLYLSSL